MSDIQDEAYTEAMEEIDKLGAKIQYMKSNLPALVEKMRNSQKEYFKTRSKESLIESKRLEKEVDQALKTLDE